MSLVQTTLDYLKKRRDNILQGNVNCIPSPLEDFRNDFVGIEQGSYYLLSANQKGGKTQFASFMFIYTPILYAYDHPDKVDVKIMYIPLEETPEKILIRFMSYLLYTLSNRTIRISPSDLQSVKEGAPVSKEILDLLENEEYRKRLEYFEEHVTFLESSNPTGIYKECMNYASAHGKRIMKKGKVTDKFTGEVKEVDMFERYEPTNPKEYVIIFTDHVSLLTVEKDMDLRNTITKFSSYMVILRNNYKYIPVVVQQQTSERQGNESFKLNKLRPDVNGLADSKYTSRDCDVMLGLFNPYSFEVPKYPSSDGYNILRLRDAQRFLEVVLNRHGEANGLKALYFDGAVSFFHSLPLPSDPRMEQFYRWVENVRHRKNSAPETLNKQE